MDSWPSFSELINELGLEADPADRDSVRSAIRKAIGDVHPDRHGGTFPDDASEARYARLLAALQFVDKPPSTALVPIDQIPALVAAIKQSLDVPPVATPAQSRAEFRDIARSDIRQSLFLPRVGSGVFAGACGFLLTVGDKFGKDPLFGPWISSTPGRVAMLLGLGYSAALFVGTWWMEQRSSARSEWLLTEEGRRAVLAEVTMLAMPATRPDLSTALRFRFSSVVNVIRGAQHRRLVLPFAVRISGAAAEKLAKTNLDELESRGLVRKVTGRALEIEYEMDADVAKELLGMHRPPAI